MVEQSPERRGRGRPRRNQQPLVSELQTKQEAQVEIDRFSPEAREALEKEGYSIYPLKGESLENLINQRIQGGKLSLVISSNFEHYYPFKLVHPALREYNDFLESRKKGEKTEEPRDILASPEELRTFNDLIEQRRKREKRTRIIGGIVKPTTPTGHEEELRTFIEQRRKREPLNSTVTNSPIAAIKSEVAINLREPFLPNSNHKNQLEQAVMVRKFSEEIRERIQGTKAIIGELPDYGELLLRLAPSDDNFIHLLDSSQEYCFTRTSTPGRGPYTVNISITNPRQSSVIKASHIDTRDGELYITPLIVPVSQ